MKSILVVAILALACSASAFVVQSFPLSYSAPLSYYYHPSIRTFQTPVLHNPDVPLEIQSAWQNSIPTPYGYASLIVEAPKAIWTKSFQTPVVNSTPVVQAPKTTLIKGVPAPVAYHSSPEFSYAYTPIVHQKVVVAQPEASYIGSTRGATHIAPLPGHSESVISQNLEPANGTA